MMVVAMLLNSVPSVLARWLARSVRSRSWVILAARRSGSQVRPSSAVRSASSSSASFLSEAMRSTMWSMARRTRRRAMMASSRMISTVSGLSTIHTDAEAKPSLPVQS